jgi:hypothetical protein
MSLLSPRPSMISNIKPVNVELGNIISVNIYRTAEAPLYQRGNTNIIIINILAILLFLFTKTH